MAESAEHPGHQQDACDRRREQSRHCGNGRILYRSEDLKNAYDQTDDRCNDQDWSTNDDRRLNAYSAEFDNILQWHRGLT